MARLTGLRGTDPEGEFFPPKLLRDRDRNNSYLEIYMTSFICGSSAEMATYPLDLVKTRMHIQGYFPDRHGVGYTYRNAWATAKGVILEEGVMKLYAGLSAQLVRQIFFGGTKFIIYDALSKHLRTRTKDNKFQISYFNSCFCAVMAGGGANLLTVPTELFKIRMQMEAKRRAAGLPPRINNVIHGLTSTVRRNGFYGLWGGVGPTTWRGALHTLADVGTYDFFKRSLIKVLGIPDNRGIHFVAALLSGIAVVVLSNPPDVVRSRVMFQPRDKRGRGLHFKNGRQCFMRLIREEGIMAMYKGWLPFWLRVGPWTFIFWFTFEHLRGRRGDQHRYN